MSENDNRHRILKHTSVDSAPDAPFRPPRHGIYVASKCRHAAKWKALRAEGWPIISSWLDESEPGQTSSFADLWVRNVREASTAAAVLFYTEPGETMKGALVEIGAALAHGVPVYGVGVPAEGYTFREHPAFCDMGTLEEALRCMSWVKSLVATADHAAQQRSALDAVIAPAAPGDLISSEWTADIIGDCANAGSHTDAETNWACEKCIAESIRTAQKELSVAHSRIAYLDAKGKEQGEATDEAIRERDALRASLSAAQAEIERLQEENRKFRCELSASKSEGTLAVVKSLRDSLDENAKLVDKLRAKISELERELAR